MENKRTFTEAEIKEVNETIAELQRSISLVEDSVKAKDFNDALKNIVTGIKATNCPICKEKLLSLSAEVIKTQKACNSNSGQCNIMINDTIKKARDIREEFVPIATERNISNNRRGLLDVPSARSIIEQINAERKNV